MIVIFHFSYVSLLLSVGPSYQYFKELFIINPYLCPVNLSDRAILEMNDILLRLNPEFIKGSANSQSSLPLAFISRAFF
jgi:hypothetical protein